MELENYAKKQEERIQEKYKFLEEERVVYEKDVALHWIISIATGYDNATTCEELMNVIDELCAYALLGSKCVG